jgi:hypothetical protein
MTGRTGASPRTPAQRSCGGKSDLTLPPLRFYPDGSYRSVLVNSKVRGKARAALLEAARAGRNLDPRNARYVRVIEYEVPDRESDGKDEVIALITTILDFPDAPAAVLAAITKGGSTRPGTSSSRPTSTARERSCAPNRRTW